MNDTPSKRNYSFVIQQIQQNIIYFKNFLNLHSIKYNEEFNETKLNKIISKLNSSYSMIPTNHSQILLFTSKDYMIKIFYLYPELKKIKKELKLMSDKKIIFDEVKSFLKYPKNEKNAILLNGKKGVFNSIKCLNIEESFMMFIYDNKTNLFSTCISLRQFVECNDTFIRGKMNENVIKHIACQIFDFINSMNGFEYLVHGNLSIDNIYLFKNSNQQIELKVTDFTYSKYLTIKNKIYTKNKIPQFVNELYQSPNYFLIHKGISRKNASKCDLYSFGLILFYLATGKEAFEGLNNISPQEKEQFIQSQVDAIPTFLKEKGKSSEFIKVIKELLPQSCENTHKNNKFIKWIQKGRENTFNNQSPLLIIEEGYQSFLTKKRERDTSIQTPD